MKIKQSKTKILMALAIIGVVMALSLKAGADDGLARVGSGLLWPAVAFLGFAIWRHRTKKTREMRPGLLNTQNRPPLSRDERTVHIATLVMALKNHDTQLKQGEDAPQSFARFLASHADAEIARLASAWTQANPGGPSDDELRSIGLIARACYNVDGQLLPMPSQDLEMLADIDTVLTLRSKVGAILEDRAAEKSARSDWLAKVGDPNADHLLKNGWIPFLQSLPGPDIRLWHHIVGDAHELFNDRLDAAFWITSQPECDKTTALALIEALTNGILSTSLSWAISGEKPTSHIMDRFFALIERWNSQFYQFHSLGYEPQFLPEPNHSTRKTLNTRLELLEQAFDISMPRIKEFDFDFQKPKDDLSRSVPSAFDFWDDEGLHLKFPNLWQDAIPTGKL